MQYTFRIRSMRNTIAEVEMSMACRWFLDLLLYLKASTFKEILYFL
ncbi:transposase [Metabacillus lacus]